MTSMVDAKLPEGTTTAAATLDAEYSPSRTAKDFAGEVERYRAGTQAARGRFAARARLHVPYGSGPRQHLDIFPATASHPSPIHLFIHGGFWQELSSEFAGFPAPAFLGSGSVFVALNYTLAPQARLDDIVAEVRRAYDWIVGNAAAFGGDPARVVVSGHSAGAHLAASLIATEGARGAAGLRGLVLVSGVFALEPIRHCYVNDALGLTEEEAARRDVASAIPFRDVPVRIFVGADETAEFRRQSALLRDAWRPYISDLSLDEIPGRDHFDILSDLSIPGAPIHAAALDLV